MKLLGITGGIGAGKSTAGQILVELGVAMADSDTVARQIVEPGQPALDEVRVAFGGEVIGEDGSLLRGELAKKVFADESARETLEQILHPRIRAAWKAQVAEWRKAGQEMGAVQIPLLLETNAESEFDAVICLACDAVTQRRRLEARGWNDAQIQGRLASQLPMETKMLRSDHVIWNEAGIDVLTEQLERTIAAIVSRKTN